MANILFSAMAALSVCVAFGMGYLLGVNSKPSDPPQRKAEEDEIKRARYEMEQQAFVDCMNYSADSAYGGGE